MTQNTRSISIGINVKTASSLPKVGAYLSAFLRNVEEYAGPADISLAVSVNGGTVGLPQDDSEISVVFIPAQDEGERD